jgi:hypothetical protein
MASLDTFWAREPKNVNANVREATWMEMFTSQMDLSSVTPPMGPFPLQDNFGMLPAIALLDRSPFAKRCSFRICSVGAFRKAMSVVTNVTQAGVAGLGYSVGVCNRNGTWISSVVTHQY